MQIIIDENLVNKRLDHIISETNSDFSRSYIKELIEDNYILVNEKSTKASYKVKLDDVIDIFDKPVESLDIKPENIPLNIVYEDEDLLVINKPTGMVVHPGAGIYSHTLVNALLYHIKDLSGINGKIRPGIVHRIDKDTSGLLIVAKNDKTHNFLAQQLKDKTLNRHYLALVHNQILDSNIIIDAPIGRDKNDRTKMAVIATNSKNAITKVKVLEVFKNFTFIECQLETGRTHQIRVHLSYINHPIVGDPKYGYRKDKDEYHQYLHAYKLRFIHPKTKEYMEIEAELEDEFKNKLEIIRNEKPEI